MPYRKTRRSREQLARMQEGKARARMAQPAEDRAPELPELRRRIVITDYDFGKLALLGVDRYVTAILAAAGVGGGFHPPILQGAVKWAIVEFTRARLVERPVWY